MDLIPPASSAVVRRRFEQQARRDTAPEMAVRRWLHAAGVRYRVDVRLVPQVRSRADIAWRGRKLAVFVDGCFWHCCPAHQHWPTANGDWWRAKLEANVRRDRRTDRVLAEQGWTVLRFWEHQDTAAVCGEITRALDGADARRAATRPARCLPGTRPRPSAGGVRRTIGHRSEGPVGSIS